MLFAGTIARQARNAAGPLGRIVAWFMARETAPENDVAVRLLAPSPEARILEVSCGHGRTLRQLARLVPAGQAIGVDGSATMLEIARKRNAAAVRSGRVRLLQADSIRIPFPDAAFDGVLAVHVVYFWRDPGGSPRRKGSCGSPASAPWRSTGSASASAASPGRSRGSAAASPRAWGAAARPART